MTSEKPLILVTNDDGFRAEGLLALREAVADLGDVWVVAPATEQSAISHAITLWDPVRIVEHEPQVYAVTGTPTDCVYIAVNHILDRMPDLCVSGINHGANLGDDVIYSGTVAGAAEACLFDIPSVAVSLASYRSRNFDAAASAARKVSEAVLRRGLPRGVLLNVNVPKGASATSPLAVTKLGRRTYGKQVTEKRDPRNRRYYWIGGSELGFDDIPGSDCNAIAREQVSISPVQLDLTNYRFLREMRHWDEFAEVEDE
jgi:5'-nucleotidase